MSCVFSVHRYAELLLGKTLLPGRDYMDQLRRTIKLVGQPKEEEMEFLVHEAAKKVCPVFL